MYFQEKSLLTPPVSRAAYSDRTSWLMAEMARLAYYQFEGVTALESKANDLMNIENKAKFIKEIQSVISNLGNDKNNARTQLDSYLELAEFKVINIFNEKATQAFLAIRDEGKVAVLAFRGTEMNLADIKTDLKTNTIDLGEYSVHEGFYQAFKNVEPQISAELNKLEGYVLYITGHSLGGALALLATKHLGSDSIGACYTFGSPRVASSAFSDDIKTPIYRVINAADIVPRIPPAYIPRFFSSVFDFLSIPVISPFLVSFFNKMSGYQHHGDMRQLTACSSDYSNLRLIANPNMIDRGLRLISRWIDTFGKAAASDHSIDAYCKKLEAYAIKRNK